MLIIIQIRSPAKPQNLYAVSISLEKPRLESKYPPADNKEIGASFPFIPSVSHRLPPEEIRVVRIADPNTKVYMAANVGFWRRARVSIGISPSDILPQYIEIK